MSAVRDRRSALTWGYLYSEVDRRSETREQREHRHDRELAAALHHRDLAKTGRGYRFVARR